MDHEIITVGNKVNAFEIDVFNPAKHVFEKFSLKAVLENKRWLILFFYPADFTFVCPTELKDISDKYEELKKMGCEVLSLSTDTHFAHLAWQSGERLLKDVKFPMGSDIAGRLAKMFGVYDDLSGLSLRGTFIINKESVLISSEINFYNVGRNAEELVRKIKANEYLLSHPDEACPANWEPGKKTLSPSEKIVGKIFEALGE